MITFTSEKDICYSLKLVIIVYNEMIASEAIFIRKYLYFSFSILLFNNSNMRYHFFNLSNNHSEKCTATSFTQISFRAIYQI